MQIIILITPEELTETVRNVSLNLYHTIPKKSMNVSINCFLLGVEVRKLQNYQNNVLIAYILQNNQK